MNNDLEQFSENMLKKMAVGDIYPTTLEMAALARIALAAKHAKPVAYLIYEKAKPARLSFQNLNGFVSKSDIEEHELWQEVLYTTPQPAHTEQVIPDGWKLVPIEPVFEMLSAGGCNEHHADNECSHHKNRRRIWAAMLAAAPKPESE